MFVLKPIANLLQNFEYWNGKLLSYVGRLCLIDYEITASFVHSFIVCWPVTLITYMSPSIRNFFWSSLILIRKRVIVAWFYYCLPKKNGGLGSKKYEGF